MNMPDSDETRPPARVLVLVDNSTAVETIRDALGSDDVVETDQALLAGLGETVDLCLVGLARLDSVATRLRDRRRNHGPARAPSLGVSEGSDSVPAELGPEGLLDDVVDPDAPIPVIAGRIDGLLHRRWLAREFDRERTFYDRLTGRVTHDLRSDITAASGYLDIARETGEPTHFDKAATALDRMADALEQLTGLMKYTQTTPAADKVDLRESVGAARQSLGPTDITVVPPSSTVTLTADPDWLIRSLVALLGLAEADAAESGRTVSVAARGEAPGFMIEDDEANRSIYAALEDPTPLKSDQEYAFRLALARRIIDAHGWTVTVEPTDQGTRIVVATNPEG